MANEESKLDANDRSKTTEPLCSGCGRPHLLRWCRQRHALQRIRRKSSCAVSGAGCAARIVAAAMRGDRDVALHQIDFAISGRAIFSAPSIGVSHHPRQRFVPALGGLIARRSRGLDATAIAPMPTSSTRSKPTRSTADACRYGTAFVLPAPPFCRTLPAHRWAWKRATRSSARASSQSSAIICACAARTCEFM